MEMQERARSVAGLILRHLIRHCPGRERDNPSPRLLWLVSTSRAALHGASIDDRH